MDLYVCATRISKKIAAPTLVRTFRTKRVTSQRFNSWNWNPPRKLIAFRFGGVWIFFPGNFFWKLTIPLR